MTASAGRRSDQAQHEQRGGDQRVPRGDGLGEQRVSGQGHTRRPRRGREQRAGARASTVRGRGLEAQRAQPRVARRRGGAMALLAAPQAADTNGTPA